MRITEELIIDVENDLYKGPCHFVVTDESHLFNPYINSFIDLSIDGITYKAFISQAVVEETGKENFHMITCYILTQETSPFLNKEIVIR